MQEMDAANCGVTNPLSNLGSGLAEMGGLTEEARAYQLDMQKAAMTGGMMEHIGGGMMQGQQPFNPMFEQPLTMHMPQDMSFMQENNHSFVPQQQFEPGHLDQQFHHLSMREPEVNLDQLYDESPFQNLSEGPWLAQQQQQPFMASSMMPMMNMMNMQQPMMQPMMQPFDQSYAPFAPEPIFDNPEAKVEEPVSVPMGGMSFGMDKAMIDRLMQSGDPKWRNSKFLKFIDQIQKGEVEFKDNQVVYKAAAPTQVEFVPESVDEKAAEGAAEQLGEEWAAEFDVSQAAQEAEEAFQGGSMEEWMQRFSEGKGLDWAQHAAIPQKDPEYVFSPENQFLDTSDPYAMGKVLLREGKLKPAIKAFEAATQKDPTHADAWRYLGQCQAENEDERLAIAALLRCISLDPYNLPALLMLGVSYTNDLAESRALNYLKTWMVNNSDYQGTEVMEHVAKIEEYTEMYGGTDGNFDGFLHEQVTKMFLKAAEINPKDADVFTVLGVLYHISSEFDLAIEAFRKAVEINPTDPTLWNKLGATQANSSKSAEAVSAYKSALQLRPTYVRALANLAIAFANQGLHEDAVRTYLATLKQNPTADHVWSYLRVSLSNMNRADLVKLTDQKDVELFREHFRF
jgi:peroxin-5